MSLFRLGEFTLNSGQKSRFKIDCDALTAGDWETLAAMAAEVLPPFGSVLGVPYGGVPFATALERYAVPDASKTLLLAEDVVTTGGAIERYRAGFDRVADWTIAGVCVFARGQCPTWVTPLFSAGAASAARDRDRLLAAIRKHMNTPGDDRCFQDDHELYSSLPEGDTRPAREVAVTIENCQRYIACRQGGREYVSPQRRIEELEAEVADLRRRLDEAVDTLGRD